MTVGIVLLAMIALFVGLRLYAVLGQRTGHEQRPVTRPEATPGLEAPAPAPESKAPASEPSGLAFGEGAAAGIRSIISADPAAIPDGLRAASFVLNVSGVSLTAYVLLQYAVRARDQALDRSEGLLLNVLPRSIAERSATIRRIVADRWGRRFYY